ncbi:histone deacetylase HDT1-like isoform X2 [Mangifera indica]|uniref:histone deacetylase HDT1-like isoform X2 n=1 Tax=Mangifera indica TaxID=29780 RepID=UPI001CFA97D9|nr:histone deacetylase HDT1-like isoform X2 [Mangifera indica]
MEFWGIEVKSGQPQKVNPGGRRVIHLSQASLGEVKDKGNGHVCLYLKVDDKKLVLGTLSPLKLPQLSFDLVLEKDFELSHNWKNGSVYFTGYKVKMDQRTVPDSDDSDSDEDVKEILLRNNGRPELQAKSVSEQPNFIKPSASTAKENVNDVKPDQKFDDSDTDDSDSKDSSSDDETSDDEDTNHINDESDKRGREHDESDEEDEDSDESESESDDEDETPKKAEPSRKRTAESVTKSPIPDKKTKFITPQRTGKKGVVHTPTPHPSKLARKTPANSSQSKQQTQKSGGSFSCKSCNRSFTTEGGLQAHTKAKHGAAA